MRESLLTLAALFILALPTQARMHKVDVSPAFLTNLSEGHSGSFMGASVSADYYLSDWSAFRTTVGFTKERYYPSEMDYDDANYGFWLSAAPVVQVNLGQSISPYGALLGTVSGVGRPRFNSPPVGGLEMSPYQNMSRDLYPGHTLLSLGASVGTKVKVSGPVSIFGEVTHYFYSIVSSAENYYPGSLAAFGRPLDFERNPTYLSLGLSCSLHFGKADQ